MSETTKLLPCPFCGSRRVSMLGNDSYVEDRWRQVRCDACGGRSNEFPSNSGKAAAHWNTRAAAGAWVTEEDRDNIEVARSRMGAYRSCDSDVGNLLDIIDRLPATVHQTGNTARDAALEEAASWHDEQEANSRAAMASASRHNSGDHIVAMYRYIAQTHANSAERIRAMKGGDGVCSQCGGDGIDHNHLNDPGPCPACGGAS